MMKIVDLLTEAKHLKYKDVPAGKYYWIVNKKYSGGNRNGYSLTSAGNWKRVALNFMGGKDPSTQRDIKNLTVFKTAADAEKNFKAVADRLGVNVSNLTAMSITKK